MNRSYVGVNAHYTMLTKGVRSAVVQIWCMCATFAYFECPEFILAATCGIQRVYEWSLHLFTSPSLPWSKRWKVQLFGNWAAFCSINYLTGWIFFDLEFSETCCSLAYLSCWGFDDGTFAFALWIQVNISSFCFIFLWFYV